MTAARPPELIFTAADHRCIPGALIALYSAAQQHDSAKDYVLVTSNPNSHYLSPIIYQLFEAEGATLRVIPTSSLPISEWNGATSRYPVEAFARYFPDQLGSDAEVALYIDCDFLIMPAINEISLDLNAGKCIFAFQEYHDLIKSKNLFRNNDRIGLPRNEVYYNSGFLLFDVPRFVESGVRTKMKQVLARWGQALDYPDQDALNLTAREFLNQLPAGLASSPPLWRILPFKYHELAFVHFLDKHKPWDRRAYKIPRDLLDIYDSYAFNLDLTNPIMGPRKQKQPIQANSIQHQVLEEKLPARFAGEIKIIAACGGHLAGARNPAKCRRETTHQSLCQSIHFRCSSDSRPVLAAMAGWNTVPDPLTVGTEVSSKDVQRVRRCADKGWTNR